MERYLRLLEAKASTPRLESLTALVGSHLRRVPFENISKLLLFEREGAGRPITLTEFLDGIEHHDLGGTCYSSNPFLAHLLVALGYDASLFGADMSTPNVHTSIRVRVGEVDYHVDVGYAAPFASPMALDRLPYEIRSGHDRYVLERAAGGEQMTVYTNGERRHGYLVHPPVRDASFFEQTIVESFAAGRTFMRCLRITRFFEHHTIELRNRRLLRISGDEVSERAIGSLAELRRAVDEQFLMPRCPIERAVAVLERVNGRAFFGPERWADSTD